MKRRIEDLINELENPHFHDLDKPHYIGFNSWVSEYNRSRLADCVRRYREYRLSLNK
jgi:hypothetical protein